MWIKVGHIQGDVLGPFPGSAMAIGGGRQRAPKWPKIAINGPFVDFLCDKYKIRERDILLYVEEQMLVENFQLASTDSIMVKSAK